MFLWGGTYKPNRLGEVSISQEDGAVGGWVGRWGVREVGGWGIGILLVELKVQK